MQILLPNEQSLLIFWFFLYLIYVNNNKNKMKLTAIAAFLKKKTEIFRQEKTID